jgi:putative phosphoribosyl transferase
MRFRNRQDAGQKLAIRLGAYRAERPVILALPRGGVPVAAEVARALHAPLDLVLVRKLGVPWQPELAMGAVVDGGAPLVVRNESVVRIAGISDNQFAAVCEEELVEIERRRKAYLGDRARADIAGRTAIVVDDGIATGATTRAALRATRMRNPKKLVLAVPVGPAGIVQEMLREADDVICLEEEEFFGAISLYYSDFPQVQDREVVELLSHFAEKDAVESGRSSTA